MSYDVPSIQSQDDYDDWIDSMVEQELKHVCNELDRMTQDSVLECVEHSGSMVWEAHELLPVYQQVTEFGHNRIGHYFGTIEPTETDLLDVIRRVTARQLKRDVQSAVLGELELNGTP